MTTAIRQQAQTLYRAWLWGDAPGAAEARRYLTGRTQGARGIAREVALMSDIGFVPIAPEGPADTLLRALVARGVPERQVQTAALACRTNDGNGLQDFPAGGGYLVFPIKAVNGDVQGFKYRAVPSLARADGMRYTGTTGSMGGAMFGWERWAPSDRTIIAIEGEIDQMSIETVRLHYPELPRPLAWYGKELTDERLAFLTGRVDHVLLALDADGGGWDGMLRSGRKLGQAGIRHALVQLPHGMDPNEVLTQGSAGLLAHFLQHGPRFSLLEMHTQHLIATGIAEHDPVYAARALRETWLATQQFVTPKQLKECAVRAGLPADKVFVQPSPAAPMAARVHPTSVPTPATPAMVVASVGAA
jgi:DNA primase